MVLIGAFPRARRLIAVSIVARLPLAMVDIGLLVHAREQTGSYAQAGVVTGAYAIALGVGGPLLGRLVDRHGRTSVLLASTSVASALLVTIAVLPAHVPLAVLAALAAGSGLGAPPIGACLRTALPALTATPENLGSAYAIESSFVELTYILGPPLALGVGSLWSSGAALALAGLALLAATAVFVAQLTARRWQPTFPARSSRGSSFGTQAMRTLVIILFLVGLLLGADEVALLAAVKAIHATTAAAPLFAVWGAGSFCGGLVIARVGGRARTAAGLTILLGALMIGHLALIPVDGGVTGLGVVLFVAGAAIAPTEGTLYAMVDRAAPGGNITEAFAWLATAMEIGSAAGAAGAGVVADRAGSTAAFALAGGAGALALIMSGLRARTLAAPHPRVGHPATPSVPGYRISVGTTR